MPTLDEVFALAPKGKFKFNIETKIFADHPELAPPPDEFVRLVLAVVRRHHLEGRVILQSFDFRTLHEMKKQAPEIKLAALYEGQPKAFVEIGREAGADIVSPNYHLVTPEEVAAAHAAGLLVIPWTANTPGDLGSPDRGQGRCDHLGRPGCADCPPAARPIDGRHSQAAAVAGRQNMNRSGCFRAPFHA